MNVMYSFFQVKETDMSFIFDWIYRGFSGVLQLLGSSCFTYYIIVDQCIKCAFAPKHNYSIYVYIKSYMIQFYLLSNLLTVAQQSEVSYYVYL